MHSNLSNEIEGYKRTPKSETMKTKNIDKKFTLQQMKDFGLTRYSAGWDDCLIREQEIEESVSQVKSWNKHDATPRFSWMEFIIVGLMLGVIAGIILVSHNNSQAEKLVAKIEVQQN